MNEVKGKNELEVYRMVWMKLKGRMNEKLGWYKLS